MRAYTDRKQQKTVGFWGCLENVILHLYVALQVKVNNFTCADNAIPYLQGKHNQFEGVHSLMRIKREDEKQRWRKSIPAKTNELYTKHHSNLLEGIDS